MKFLCVTIFKILFQFSHFVRSFLEVSEPWIDTRYRSRLYLLKSHYI